MEIPAVERFEEQVKYGRFHICNYVLEVQLGNEEMKNKAEMEKRVDTAVISVLACYQHCAKGNIKNIARGTTDPGY